ncbi:MAG: hypothetical protein RLN90_03610 [Balneolaceae bacterium]
MSQEQKIHRRKFHEQYKMFKDNHKPDYELKDIFEIYLPFWFCRQNVVVEKDIELDRFSKIILQTIQSGFAKHSDVCKFLGVEINSFVVSQFHFLIKNGLLDETPTSNDTKYEITHDGVSFLERKKKVTSVETVEFEYFYNDLTLEFLDTQRFNFLVNDMTKEFVDTTQPLDKKNVSSSKRKIFSGYQVLQTNRLPVNRIEIPHKNRPYNLNKVEFASFFNKQHKDSSFYDFESAEREMHKRSICFLALEYEDKTGVKTYDIRHSNKTVKTFDRHEIEESLTKKSSDYFKKYPLTKKEEKPITKAKKT